MSAARPLPDRLEVAAPRLAALVVRGLPHLPEPLRRRFLQDAFDRARGAFNRGDLDVVFALFDPDVEYVPPPASTTDRRCAGNEVVRDALRRQVQVERFAALQRYGRERAEALGIGPEDSEALVDEMRSRRG